MKLILSRKKVSLSRYGTVQYETKLDNVDMDKGETCLHGWVGDPPVKEMAVAFLLPTAKVKRELSICG